MTGDVEIAVALSLSGEEAPFCRPLLEGIKLALEEENVGGAGSQMTLKTYDDEGTVEGAKRVAGQIVASRAEQYVSRLMNPQFEFAYLFRKPLLPGLAKVLAVLKEKELQPLRSSTFELWACTRSKTLARIC